jgi:predicted amidophosphoribosyltransferase
VGLENGCGKCGHNYSMLFYPCCPKCGYIPDNNKMECASCLVPYINQLKYCPRCGYDADGPVKTCAGCQAPYYAMRQSCPRCGVL